jgi:poly(A) polymerase
VPTFHPDDLDPEALNVIRVLAKAGHEAYLVGGCVRDLLIGSPPKDFDLATSAHPGEIKEIFGRRCRIIGKRFQLAHVRSGSSLLEVATFRGSPERQETAGVDSGFVVRANHFGTAEEDAWSRDFTINGLFYDPIADRLIDFVGGQEDLAARRLRTIGDSERRFREDPVRLLRAVKFAARLGLEFDPAIPRAAPVALEGLPGCPLPRVTEEVFRVFESGYAARGLTLLSELGCAGVLMPELEAFYRKTPEALLVWLRELDRLTVAHGPLPRDSIYVLMVWPLCEAVIRAAGAPANADWALTGEEVTTSLAVKLGIPIRHRQRLRGTLRLLRWMEHPGTRRRPRAMCANAPSLPLALTMLRVKYTLGGPWRQEYEAWREATAADVCPAPFAPRDEEADDGGGRHRHGGPPVGPPQGAGGEPRGRRRPTRRRRRGGQATDAG